MKIKTLFKISVAVAAIVAAPFAFSTPLDMNDYTKCVEGSGLSGVSVDDVKDNAGSASECFGAESSPNNIGNYSELEWDGTVWSRESKWNGSNSVGEELTITLPDTWSFSGDTSSWTSYFIITKAGSNPGWAGYYFDMPTLNGDAFEGTWQIPWSNGNSDTPTELSHMSIFSLKGVQVSEPGTLALFGLGMLGLGLARRKR